MKTKICSLFTKIENKLESAEEKRPGTVLLIFILGIPIFVPLFMSIIFTASKILGYIVGLI